ncbi:hypothetical protein NEOLEDRAFT_1139771 [Neolentinus lepideus HHB14362 ss-1]|uniref:Carbohydrate-binding module family 19 domain-containing protein n=1 Tax=Neolentinus lepideus HHB14362 ss-1 TaxID=1314782 RepID=A0A165PK12_9AGAM|nr:hypothetical protein NEOLEDRAFT_1139771 [Neolentinus lepideus HHB14362 ss-1]
MVKFTAFATILALSVASTHALPFTKRIAQVIADSTTKWEAACDAAGGGQQCNPTAVNAFGTLLAAAGPCDQQNAADTMVDLAKQLNQGDNSDMIKFAQIFAQQPRNSPNSLSVPYCQQAPKNPELNGLFQCQYKGDNPTTFVGNIQVGGNGTIPFGKTSAVSPPGSCPANTAGPIADGTQLTDITSDPGVASTGSGNSSGTAAASVTAAASSAAVSPSAIASATQSAGSSEPTDECTAGDDDCCEEDGDGDETDSASLTVAATKTGAASATAAASQTAALSAFPAAASASALGASLSAAAAATGAALSSAAAASGAALSSAALASGAALSSAAAATAASLSSAAVAQATGGATSGFALSNGQAAQKLNAQFGTLTASSSCTDGENACVGSSFAMCVNGAYVLMECNTGAGLTCAALPLVNSPGTSVTCTTQADAVARIARTGATGGLTGSGN